MNMKRFMNKKVVAIGLAAGLTLGAAGAAFAYFTTSGSGNGTATVGSTSNDWAVSNVAYSSGPLALFPGVSGDSTMQTWGFKITNSTTGALGLQNVTVTVEQSSLTGGCEASWFQVDGKATSDTFNADNGMTLADSTPSPITSLPHDVAASDNVTGTFTLQLVDNGSVQDACQGQTPTVTVAAS